MLTKTYGTVKLENGSSYPYFYSWVSGLVNYYNLSENKK